MGDYWQYVDDMKSGQEHSLRSIFGIRKMVDTTVSREILGRKEDKKKERHVSNSLAKDCC